MSDQEETWCPDCERLQAEIERLRDATWAMVEKEAAKHLPAYEKQHKRIAELEAELDRAANEIHRLGMKCSQQEDSMAELEAEIEQLRYERAQAGKRAMSAETEVERLREAHQKNVDQYRHNGSIWPSICAARMCDNSLKALEDE